MWANLTLVSLLYDETKFQGAVNLLKSKLLPSQLISLHFAEPEKFITIFRCIILVL